MEVLQRTANRGSISTGYDIDNSVKLEADNTEYFSRTPSSNSNRQTFTYSTWVKRTELGLNGGLIEAFQDGSNFFLVAFTTSDQIVFYNIDSGTDYGNVTTQLFRDTSAWYHIVFVSDTTNSTASNRYQLYVNGVRITSFSSDYGTPPQNYNNNLNSTIQHNIGRRADGNTYNCCYLAETHLVDGTALAPTAFGEFDDDSGIWKPIKVSGVTYGTNGFYLNYITASDMGNDKSGENNDFAENNITAADQATDTPTNNFATLNVLNRNTGYSSGVTNNSLFTEGNTKITGNLVDYWQSGVSTIGITSGKWYFEARPFDSNTKICTIGYGDEADIENWGRNNDFPGAASSKSYGYAGGTTAGYGQIIPSTSKPNPAVTYNQTNIIGVAIDADNGYVYWSKDGTYVNSGNPASGASGTGGIAVPTGAGTNGTLFPAVGFYYDGTVPIMLLNFGGYTTMSISSAASDANGYGTFEYAPPSGYLALCTKNLAETGG